jgi:predicted O-methyltransferase YrrM
MDILNLEKITFDGNGDSDQHVLTLYSIALGSKAKKILELGVRNGDSTRPLLAATIKNGGHLTSVDINETKFNPGYSFDRYWTFVKQDALEFLKAQNPSEPYDLIFLDDWHSYEHVKKELDEIDR